MIVWKEKKIEREREKEEEKDRVFPVESWGFCIKFGGRSLGLPLIASLKAKGNIALNACFLSLSESKLIKMPLISLSSPYLFVFSFSPFLSPTPNLNFLYSSSNLKGPLPYNHLPSIPTNTYSLSLVHSFRSSKSNQSFDFFLKKYLKYVIWRLPRLVA